MIEPERPTVSVIMANHQGGRYITAAIESVLAQTLGRLEIIVSDDASSDDSVAKVAALMMHDRRIRLIRSDKNGGPAHCRNRALAEARGEWIAIVDSDDLLHPERFERLLAAADDAGCDMVADDLLHFHEDGTPAKLLLPDGPRAALDVSPADWILAGTRGTPALGYIKPMIRASRLANLRYDEELRIGEDYDLILRILLAGTRLRLIPEPWYLYRRHRRSLSYRSSPRDLRAMIDTQCRLAAIAGPFEPAVAEALAVRMHGLTAARAFEELAGALKRRDAGTALAAVVRHPSTLMRLARTTIARGSRRPNASPGQRAPEEVVLSETATADQTTVRVPPYVPLDCESWGGRARRGTWLEIADLSRAGVRLLPEGPAGAYAAGFAPGPRTQVQPAMEPHAMGLVE